MALKALLKALATDACILVSGFIAGVVFTVERFDNPRDVELALLIGGFAVGFIGTAMTMGLAGAVARMRRLRYRRRRREGNP